MILTSQEVVNTNASELSWFHGLNSSYDSEGEVGFEVSHHFQEVCRMLDEARAKWP